MFGNAKTVMYARRKVILDNLETTGFNKTLHHAVVVLNMYNVTIEGINVRRATKDIVGDDICVMLVLDIRCRCADWAAIEDDLRKYVCKTEQVQRFDDITTAMD